ncbi:MAG: glycoside hydrolase family 3 C-terminal domain-containing protein [Bacteroidetes bacterium]|nr:glycoside hydrolase family 3 C-terminal domain-containing protein [Bacteroidota bacterium]
MSTKIIGLFCLTLLLTIKGNSQEEPKQAASLPYLNTNLSWEARVDDLLSRMTLAEKIGQLQYTSSAIPRLGIQEYNWWNECLHGVARNGIATVFPQAIGMAATWDTELIHNEADVISTEARAKYTEALSKNEHGIYQGLTFWSPNINIFRDPRWGRGQETYGEDPFLTSEIGKAFVKGLQGDDPRYLKVVATAKHFAVHSGPEPLRHKFDAWPSQRDLFDTYLPAFEALVRQASVASVMSSYNRVYGTPSSANSFLLEDLLRKKWGFQGYVVSDCWAISDIYNFHQFVPTAEKASALTLKAGVDLSCGPEYSSLEKAIELGFTTESEVDQAVGRLLIARFRLGMFDPPAMVPYASITPSQNNTEEHRKLALQVAHESIVLLKNDKHILPLSGKLRKIAVIGPYANDTSVLLGNYNGIPSSPFTLLKGIQNRAGKNCRITYAPGSERPEARARRLKNSEPDAITPYESGLEADALRIAANSDVIIYVGGISPGLEGEEMDVKVSGFSGGDRTDIEQPANQLRLLEKLKATGKPVVLVITNGSALAVRWANQNLDAIVEAWYPGEEGGNAVADVLFGKYNPAGRLPVTFYNKIGDLPPFEDYSMIGRTYRYTKTKSLFPFGYGLSYSSFEYKSVSFDHNFPGEKDTLGITIQLKNVSEMPGDEVIQVYAHQPENIPDQPVKTLIGFRRVSFSPGEVKDVKLMIPVSRLRHFEPLRGDYVIAEGTYEIQLGTSSDDIKFRKILEVK